MKVPKKKDNLTDLVEILDDGADETVSNNGKVTASDGEVVTLSAEDDRLLDKIARGLIKQFKRKKQQEKEVLEFLAKKQIDKK